MVKNQLNEITMNIYTMLIKEGKEGTQDPVRTEAFIRKNGIGMNRAAGYEQYQKTQSGDIVAVRLGGGDFSLVEIIDSPDEEINWTEWEDFVWLKGEGEFRKVRFIDKGNLEGSLDFRGYVPTFSRVNEGPLFEKIYALYNRFKEHQMIDTLSAILNSNKQIILTGAPGTGKTYLAKELAKSIVNSDNKLTDKETDDRLGFVQFHPAYDYTDFVEGLKPVIDSSVNQGQIAFEVRDGTFMKFCRKAAKQTEPCVFIIDEINRADLSRVFGELFYALEPDYRGKKGAVSTQYQSSRKEGDREPFFVPENVYIIGTMNDVDRSVESIDFALRRRFAWYEVKADEARFDAVIGSHLGDILPEAKERYLKLNKLIEIELGSSYQIGPAYFRKIKDYVTDEKVVWGDFWKYHLELLVREYVRGRSDEKELLAVLKNAYDLIVTN